MEKRKNSDGIDSSSKRRRIGFTGKAEEEKSSLPQEITEHCRKMLQSITLSEDFVLLCRLTKHESLNFDLIQYRINAGIYGMSPGLFDSDLQKMWNRVREIGQQMILDADELSHISQVSYKKHVGGFLHDQDEENNDNESEQMLTYSDKGHENEDVSPSLHEAEDSSDSQQMSSHSHNDRENTSQGQGKSREYDNMDDLQTIDEENSDNESQQMLTQSPKSQENEHASASFHETEDSFDSQQMSIHSPNDQENDRDSTSQEQGQSREHDNMDLQTINEDPGLQSVEIQTRNSPQNSSKQEEKSETRHDMGFHKNPKIRGDKIQPHGSKEKASKGQDKSISHGNKDLRMTSEKPKLYRSKNQSYNRQQNDQENTSKEPKKLKTLHNRSLCKNKEKPKMDGDEIQTHNLQQIDQENTSEDLENSSASCQKPKLHYDKQGPVWEKKCCMCRIGRKDELTLIECSNEKCLYKFYHLRCLKLPLEAAPLVLLFLSLQSLFY